MSRLRLKRCLLIASSSLSFVYPFGATLTVQRPAIAVLSTGSTSYPLSQPVATFCTSKVWNGDKYYMYCVLYNVMYCSVTQNGNGHLCVVGSAHMFSDQYLDKEENGKLQEVMWRWMTSDDITLNTIDAENPDVSATFNSPLSHPRSLHSLPPSLQVSDYHFLPVTATSAERVQNCLHESEEVCNTHNSGGMMTFDL